MDNVFNLVALAVPPVLSYCVVLATLRGLRAMDRRAWLAKLDRQPFRLHLLAEPEWHAATGSSGLTPEEWYANLAHDAIKGLREKAPSQLDYLREFHPERLERSTRGPRGRHLRRLTRLTRR